MILPADVAFRAAMKAAEATLLDVFKNGTQKISVPTMQTRAELYDVLGYAGYEERIGNTLVSRDAKSAERSRVITGTHALGSADSASNR
ncbi:MAG: hypothetical protein U0791_12265 [Gemmataceae bacterium]